MRQNMKTNEITAKIGNTAAKINFKLKKYSPEILVVAGVIGTVTSAVMACKATTKIEKILDEHKEKLDSIHTYAEQGLVDENLEYTQEDAKKDTTIVYVQTAFNVAKLYAPAVSLGVLSLSSILASNGILKKRNAALSAAYVAVEKGFKEYRSRVVERFGEEVDQQLRCNIKAQELEETVVNEKGKEKTVKKSVEVADPNAESDYIKYFTRTNPYWEKDSDYVEMFLRAQQNYANDKLRAVGHVTLNEVYDMLGFKHTKAGMVVGWFYDLDHPSGDNYIEFNTRKVVLPTENGKYEEAYAIDFNVDGSIYERMV